MFANKKDLETAQSKIESLESEVTALQTSLESARAEASAHAETVASLQDQLAAISAERNQASAKITELEANVIEACTSAEARAAEIVAQAGIAPVDTIADEEQENISIEQLRANIAAIADPKARMEARLKNWEKLNNY
jgi:chromosome segregation ATPase